MSSHSYSLAASRPLSTPPHPPTLQSHSCLCLHHNMPFLPPRLPDSFLGSAVRLGRAISIFPGKYLGEKSQLTDLIFLPNGRWWGFHYEPLLHDELTRNAIRWQSLLRKASLLIIGYRQKSSPRALNRPVFVFEYGLLNLVTELEA